MRLTALFSEFLESEKSGGIILITCTLLSLALSNSMIQENWMHFWHWQIGGHSLTHWINDGLMTIFFLLIGLELERELYAGELKKIRNAMLPLFAAMGGMIAPAGIYALFNADTPAISGAGIPTATDIAFSIGVLSMFGTRIPIALKIFLTAFAIIDDLGAIIIIALFYSTDIHLLNLVIALTVFVVLLILNRMKVYNLIPYLIGGVIMWYFMLQSGVHATISGVLLAFAIPFGSGRKDSPSYILQHLLHKPVAWIILPVFALANTAITLTGDWHEGLTSNLSLGIITGLVIGKPAGIMIMSFAAVKFQLASLPSGVRWPHIAGVSFLGGIGFTMSVFIALLAFNDIDFINQAKVAILSGSLIAGITGYIYLNIIAGKEVIRT